MSDEELAAWLVGVLTVEPVERDFFRGPATPQGKGRSFGGQVIGQALMAATCTVPQDRPVHSLHGYFIRPGDATAPVLYQVERDRDGGSFTTRRVVAIQNGAVILNLAASFQEREAGLSHQDQMPNVPGPEEIETEEVMAERMADRLPEGYLKWLRTPRPVDFRPCEPRPPLDRNPRAAEQRVWMRVCGPLPDDPQVHRAALAYVSDYGLLGTSTVAHGKAFGDADMQYASLDHAVWFHEDFRVDEWLLYVMDSPWAGGGRGFNRGRIFTRDGQLVASVAQEGLIRNVAPRG
ncbi:MAG TPA: acyl-CoA thioesterase II [Rhodobacteraceae bacterium]|jgi:acyl-CoA thioesterase-2|nr:acyl-CoA thioesterase II [Paracoccaceae bacterium]HBV55505.1 acyl-CoA thioesterase II [Paracoccaceae bacterium]